MALNIENVKKQVNTVGSPIFDGREKGDWSAVNNSDVTVNNTLVYTDSNGDTYGVMTFEEVPGQFFLCGKVATDIAIAVCNPENGGTIDQESGIMIEKYRIHIGEPTKTRKGGKTYLPVVLI